MTDKQIIIDYKKLCENYSKEVRCYNTFDGSCIKEQCFTYKLLQQLQAKEQECKKLKSQIEIYSNMLESSSNKILKKEEECEQALTEIKEIAEPFCNACQEFEPEKKGSNCMYCNYGKILQKISEVEK